MSTDKARRCQEWIPANGRAVQCERPAWHEGVHRAGAVTWTSLEGIERRDNAIRNPWGERPSGRPSRPPC